MLESFYNKIFWIFSAYEVKKIKIEVGGFQITQFAFATKLIFKNTKYNNQIETFLFVFNWGDLVRTKEPRSIPNVESFIAASIDTALELGLPKSTGKLILPLHCSTL